jgi:hypothetical protein
MKTTNQILSAVLAMAVIAIVVFLALGVAGPAFSTARLTAFVAQATPPPGDVIPLKPITDLTSLNATVKIDVNGLINGKKAKGNLDGALTSNNQGKSRVSVTGSLLGQIAAQVGGSVVGLFTPSKVDLYKVPGGAYVVVNGMFPVCVKPDTGKATEALDEMSPSSLLNMLTDSDVARGEYVGEETLNGKAVKHYVIDGDAFLVAAQNSSNPQLKAFGDALWSAEDADLYVDAAGGYPVAFKGSYSGAFEPLKFEGDFNVDIELTDVNTNTRVDLPAACNKPISM